MGLRPYREMPAREGIPVVGEFALQERAGVRCKSGHRRWPASSIAHQLPPAPMMLFAVGIERALDVAILPPHDANARNHRRAAVRRDQEHRLDRGRLNLPQSARFFEPFRYQRWGDRPFRQMRIERASADILRVDQFRIREILGLSLVQKCFGHPGMLSLSPKWQFK
jgi:hypothetical protein